MALNFLLEKHSNKNAPLVVMINGILADYQSFDGASFYGREFAHVLRYNCRGQDQAPVVKGSADTFNIIALKDHVNDLKELLVDILKDLPEVSAVFLVGLSNGGRISLKASEDEDFVKNAKIKSVAALDTYDELTPLLFLKLNSWYEATCIGGALHRFDVATPWIWGETFYREKEDVILSYRQKIIDSGEASTSMNVTGLLRGALKNESSDDRVSLEKISLPVFLLVGEEDLLTTPKKHQEMVTKLQKGSLKIISKMGHAGLIENPMVMKNEIIPYFKTVLNEYFEDRQRS